MGDRSPTPTPRSTITDLYSIFGITKSANLGKACKNLVKKFNPDKGNLKDDKSQHSNDGSKHQTDNDLLSHHDRQDSEDSLFLRPSFLSRVASLRSKTPTPSRSYSRSSSRRCTTPQPTRPTSRNKSMRGAPETEFPAFARSLSRKMSRRCGSDAEPYAPPASASSPTTDMGSKRSSFDTDASATTPIMSRNVSKRSTTPIIFSQSTARKKPPPIEKKLECTLEELCFGCSKKIKITRDVITNVGIIAQEEEILKIDIKPGWRKGTKITFEGKGDEKPGYLPADIVLIIDEKKHHVFRRCSDNLEVCVEIPLVSALTGCSILVPLLGGEKMTVSFENTIIYPGYEKLIPGQGMPNPKQNSRRGNLRIKFLVDFPKALSDEQRQEVVSILEDCS